MQSGLLNSGWRGKQSSGKSESRKNGSGLVFRRRILFDSCFRRFGVWGWRAVYWRAFISSSSSQSAGGGGGDAVALGTGLESYLTRL